MPGFRIVSVLPLVLMCLPSADALAQEPIAEIRQAEEALATALVKKDAAAFDRLLAPEFVLRGSPDVPRAVWIKNALSLCWGDTFEISDFSTTSNANVTIASLVLTTRRDPVSCEPSVVRSLITDVWVRRNGTLQLLLRHSGPAGGDISAQFARTAPPPPRLEGTAELSLVATGGNTDTQTLGLGGSFVWRPGAWTTRGRTAFVRSVADDELTAESLVAELRQSRTISPRAEAFVRADYHVNRFAGISFRLAVDGGIGWTLRDTPSMGLKLDAGAGVVEESRVTGPGRTFGIGTGTLDYRWQLSSTVRLDERAIVSSGLASPDNWQLQNTAGVSVSMTRRLSLKVSHDLKRVSRPAPGFRKSDTIVSAALVARF